MESFKDWLLSEIVELKQPQNAKKSKHTFDSGTNTATSGYRFYFITSLGNKVDLLFKHIGNNDYQITFYVNGKLTDDVERNEDSSNRDPEILSGVFYLIKDRTKKMKINNIRFSAHKGKKDTKVVKNKNLTNNITNLKNAIFKLKDFISSYIPKNINHSPSMQLFATQNNRTLRKTDLTEEQRNDVLSNCDKLSLIINNLQSNSSCLNQISPIILIKNEIISIINYMKLENESLYYFETAVDLLIKDIQSYREEGVEMQRNRREAVYEKLIKRHLSDEWNYKLSNTSFYLTRKDPIK